MEAKDKKGFLNIPNRIWIQLTILGLGYVIYAANRLSFGVGLKAMAKHLQMTVFQVGILSTIFTLGQALVDIPAGYLADRLGRKKMLMVAMAGIGATTIAVTTSVSFYDAAIWRFLFGTFEGMWNIVMYSVAGSIVPASRAMLNGLMMSFYSIGSYIGPAFYGWTLHMNPDNWHFGLQTIGGVSLIFVLVLYYGLNAKETDSSKDIKTMHFMEAMHAVGTNRGVWLGIAVHVLNIIPYWGFAAMGPYLMMTYKGFSSAEAGHLFGIIYGIGGITAVLLGHFADKFGRKPIILIMSVLNVICGYLLFHVIPSSSMGLIYLVGGILGIGLHSNYVMGYTVGQDAVKPEQVGLATGLIGACIYFCSFFSGPAMGFITEKFGHMAALDSLVVGFEVALVILAIFMKETMKKQG